MALDEYTRKRDFNPTSEPKPGRVKIREQKLSYLIQKHDATRLHYDFRLELDGVLLSWAVTKGPSFDPADKRLAVRTEDHPLSYGSFEGTIPEAEYGGGPVMLWDTGWWEPEGDPRAGLKKGHLGFTLHGERLKGRWNLIRMRGEGKKENWLLIKEDDAHASRRANSEFLEGLSFSVKSGLSMDEIASGEKAKQEIRTSAVREAQRTISSPASVSKPALKTVKPGNLMVSGITITHPDRVISETGHVTKGELAEYYSGVAPFLLPHIVRHPLSLLRCPAGIDGECFFQRNPGKALGADVKPFEFRHQGKKYEYLFIEDEKGLLEVIQMGAIELHPWGAPVESIDFPNRMIFDLDPAPEVPFEAVKLAAQDLRQRLRHKGLESTLKCTGGKGLHVIVLLAGKDEWAAVKSFAGSLAGEMVAAAPEAYVATMSKAKRSGKIFVDYFRNDYTATAIADYGVRARPGAPVALPLDWKELKTLKSASQFTMKDVLKRLRNRKPESVSKEKLQVLPAP
jgi:bifunctional non-homologous end joining protein LigD